VGHLPPWLSGLAISELQCSESLAGVFGRAWVRLPDWYGRGGGQARAPGQFSKAPVPPACRVRLSACNKIKISGRYRGFACVLLTLDFFVRLGLNFHPMGEFGGGVGAIGPPTFFLSRTHKT